MKKSAIKLALILASMTSGWAMAAPDLSTTQAPLLTIEDKIVLGRVENVYYQGIEKLEGVPFVGKIDTGADTTSMHAEDIEVISNNPKYQGLSNEKLLQTIVDEYGGSASDWWLEEFDNEQRNFQGIVRFSVRHPYSGEKITLERPLARTSVIRSRTSSTPIYRPVVILPMTIAGKTVETEVNLTDRSGFSAPILVGKTFLANNAWVMAGYDYLQAQKEAQVIGRREVGSVDGVNVDVSLSLKNNYSILNAQNIKLNQKDGSVTFDLSGKDKQSKSVTYPLVKMLSIGDNEYPMVYVTFKGEKEFEQPILVYLKDRSKNSTQLRLGLNTINQHFIVDTQAKNKLTKKKQSFKARMSDNPLVVSPVETLILDGHKLDAEPSFTVSTPLLKVSSFEMIEAKGRDKVEYYLSNDLGNDEIIRKTILRKIKVGDTVRPVVDGEFIVGGKDVNVEFALEALDSDEGDQPYFIIGKKTKKSGVLVNTRSENLLDAYPVFTAGHIENATVEGLQFPVKLDTGADVSSMNALDIKQFEKDGKKMVTFTYANDMDMKQTFTREVVDVMRIKAKQGEKANVRPVVEMRVKLGDVEKTVKVNLQDRSRFHYSMILGKNFLKYGVVVSSDENFLLGNEIGSH
ncbi:ATP-dependent zinc protease family protein [Vibrio methylphosphonaticus]|uniref:ATP-dependent zinc protease family protein n=1 Tax=Vibrio methylphosphonaticus TaxID=2946866 RepID=UPI00202A7A82|nr:RimK/LysX family protein [Vibrio methylphosphonaticus]MCL9776441.1 RimK/LysX family protein [Vibrio methylphosphonaticus]